MYQTVEQTCNITCAVCGSCYLHRTRHRRKGEALWEQQKGRTPACLCVCAKPFQTCLPGDRQTWSETCYRQEENPRDRTGKENNLCQPIKTCQTLSGQTEQEPFVVLPDLTWCYSQTPTWCGLLIGCWWTRRTDPYYHALLVFPFHSFHSYHCTRPFHATSLPSPPTYMVFQTFPL